MLERLVQALLQANAFILNPANRARVMGITTAQLGLKTEQEAAAIYDDTVKYYVFRKQYPTREGFTNVLSEVTKSLPKAAGLKSDVVDISILGDKRRSTASVNEIIHDRLH